MTRPAIVFLRDGRRYEGQAAIDRGWVHFEGRRRVGNHEDVTYRPAGGRVWPRSKITEIRWTTL